MVLLVLERVAQQLSLEEEIEYLGPTAHSPRLGGERARRKTQLLLPWRARTLLRRNAELQPG